MILKFYDNGKWIFIDAVETVTKDTTLNELPQDIEIIGIKNIFDKDKVSLIKASIRGKDRYLLAFDKVYLLNDEGKTIERIN